LPLASGRKQKTPKKGSLFSGIVKVILAEIMSDVTGSYRSSRLCNYDGSSGYSDASVKVTKMLKVKNWCKTVLRMP
jgi:hypothetical protein